MFVSISFCLSPLFFPLVKNKIKYNKIKKEKKRKIGDYIIYQNVKSMTKWKQASKRERENVCV